MKTRLLGAVLSVSILAFSGCGGSPSAPSVVQEGPSIQIINLSVAKTVGNHTYIPLNLSGIANSHTDTILHILDEFEKQHPEFEVTSWELEEQQDSYVRSPMLYGIWINHKDRSPQPCSK